VKTDIKKMLVVAPHADDEVLGCGGTMLRRRSEGVELGWLLLTQASEMQGWSPDRILERQQEIIQVRESLGVAPENLYELRLETTRLDQLPMAELVGHISDVFSRFCPEEVFVPHARDIHSDHRVCFEAVAACTKWFRYPFIRRVLAYETLSETDFVLRPEDVFAPNYFVDVSAFVEQKLAIMRTYRSEIGTHPFPRSETSIRALAELRGAQSGFHGAEAFQLLRERA
jgi:LmbE family N-acetylglucosaminyl deacetylase